MSANAHDPARSGRTAIGSGPDAEPSLGQRLRIRSMVTMAGEVLPFFWPMRNFIHHNPLHGLEHLPFEQAVGEATRLFHARGWLRRNEYQRLLADGEIEPAQLRALVAEWVAAWLEEQSGDSEPEPLLREQAALLERLLMAMLTELDQPAPGDRTPCAEAILACLRDGEPR
jgi:hypothetical protein